MSKSNEPAAGPFQYRDARATQAPGGLAVDRARQVGDEADGLCRRRPAVAERVGVGGVAVELRDEVHAECDGIDRLVGCKGGERGGEELAGRRAPPPNIERVDRIEPRVEQLGELLGRGRRDLGKAEPDRLRDIDHERPLGSRVVHGGYAPAPAGGGGRPDPAAGREQLERVGHLVEAAHAKDAMRLEERFPHGVTTGECSRVRRHHGPAARRGADSERHDGDAGAPRPLERGAEGLRLSEGLEQESDDTGPLEREGVVEVARRRGDQFLPRGDGHRPPESPVGSQEGGEGRTGMGDERDGSGRKRILLEIADRPQPLRHVHEAHAAAAAQGHARLFGDARQPLAQANRAARPAVVMLPTAACSAVEI